MTKKQLVATLAVSTLALAQSGVVSADETTTSPVDGTTPVVVSPAETPVDQAQPSQPVETPPTTEAPTPPATEAPVDPTTPTQPSEPATPAPSDPSTTTPSTPSEEPKSDDSTQPSGEPTSPSDNNGQATPAPSDPSTGDVPKDVKPIVTFNPFETPSGQTVVGTQNSQVIVQNTDGSTQTVKAEDIGGTTNSDGTVTLPTASGEAKTLPQTGEEGSLLSAIGLGLLSLVGVIFKKKAI
ncbi:TPA: LPXTG cell wall anchor domain-containing protein [Streptococcus agalactiae]